MNSILTSISNNIGIFFLGLSSIVFVFFLYVFKEARVQKSQQARWRELLRTPKGDDLDEMLHRHLEERTRLIQQVQELQEKVRVLENKLMSSKRHLGLVRYDAFEDVGGNQSFTLAIYDDKGNGAILNSLVGRADCRVFCKPLQNGKSERALSEEEEQAILDAVSGVPKSMLTY